ncbi:MAG: hypothetical protein KC466_12200, partial [Myxococcales bacterium]|nr:hypothetical protein [Myxococcales bacterium]
VPAAAAGEAEAAINPEGLPPAPPPVEVRPEELGRLDKGEVVLRTVRVSDDERWAEALYLFDATPVELWDLVTDPPTQQDMFKELELYEMIHKHPDGLDTHGIANAAWFIPDFEYWLRTRNDGTKQWNAWLQTKGDFNRNDGYWRFVWNPERRRTYGVLTLHLAFKGILSIVPDSWIVSLQKSNMPKAIQTIQDRVNLVREEEPDLARRRQAEWAESIANGKARPWTLQVVSN